MPKMKSHSGAKKRLRRTGNGKVVGRRGRRNHLLMQKSKRQKKLNRTIIVGNTKLAKVKALTPYL